MQPTEEWFAQRIKDGRIDPAEHKLRVLAAEMACEARLRAKKYIKPEEKHA
jgi:hypothetical protein